MITTVKSTGPALTDEKVSQLLAEAAKRLTDTMSMLNKEAPRQSWRFVSKAQRELLASMKQGLRDAFATHANAPPTDPTYVHLLDARGREEDLQAVEQVGKYAVRLDSAEVGALTVGGVAYTAADVQAAERELLGQQKPVTLAAILEVLAAKK